MRKSAWRGTWQPNARPYLTFAPDVYISLQGETSVIGCGECRRKVNYNDYVTQVSTEASVDAPPGSATVTLSIPDNDINDFYVDGQLLIQPMMEIEIFAKGCYLIGGMPQYYRIFWGVVSSATKAWDNGTTTVTISCKDILRWWEITNTTVNPAFLEGGGSSAGHYQLFQNQFAGQNPYTTIIQLAQDAMGDFFYTTGSFTSFRPEKGPESGAIGSFMKDIMAYWQLKFGNIQSNLVLYGASGQAYTFSGVQGTVAPLQIANKIFEEEARLLRQNQSTTLLFSNPKDVATAKIEVARAGDVEFFQNDTQSKLALAMQARDQLGYEFYCDTTGDVVFKPPFYNLNTLPNKPVSWIQDFDILSDQVTDSEAEVVTHVTSSGNAFGGVTDWGLNDEITTPRTGVYDFHLLRRYGWRRADLQLEWAGNPRKLFFHLLDWMDRLNAKRQNGTITIPMRPELRMGFPVWVPKYDSFFYVQGISHSYAVGGQATTTVTLVAKRSKFVAPKNIGTITAVSGKKRNVVSDQKRNLKGQDQVFQVDFPGQVGSTSGLSQDETSGGEPAVIRDPKTGKLLGFPNVVMVYKSTYSGTDLQRIMETMGRGQQKPAQAKTGSVTKQPGFSYDQIRTKTLLEVQAANKQNLISRLRAHRYESGMTNAGAYDYAFDKGRNFRELALIPLDSYNVNSGAGQGNQAQQTVKNLDGDSAAEKASINASFEAQRKQLVSQSEARIKELKAIFDQKAKAYRDTEKLYLTQKQKSGSNVPASGVGDSQMEALNAQLQVQKSEMEKAAADLKAEQDNLSLIKSSNPTTTFLPSLNVLVRPVSDEFGFEVIGHYRYGRGAYIDRGKMQIKVGAEGDQQSIANQLNIQFAPTGGFLTDGSNGANLDPSAQSFASLFEQMRPDDYVTGASFTGTVTPNGEVTDVQTTSSQTYTNLINADKGTSLFVEADATRRARTLGEMTPTIEIAGLSEAHQNCACGLNRTNWFTLLPQNLIQDILSPARSELADAEVLNNVEVTDDGLVDRTPANSNVILPGQPGQIPAQLTSSGFFQVLSKYLSDKFDEEYAENAQREDAYTLGGSTVVENPFDVLGDQEQDNVLGQPDNPLFARAANGDVSALQALQNQANFNFGLTSNAIQDFGSTLQQAGAVAGEALGDIGSSAGRLPSSPVSASTGPTQQYRPPAPSISDPINQRRYDNAGAPVTVGRTGGTLINR